MEFCDINVRVLYDFEYTTKYGRKINISSGERLLLIKKTNKDWWQVIRSSEQRPFYVPASYVKEVEPKPVPAVRYQSKTKSILDSSESNTSSSRLLQKDSQETNLKLTKSSSNLSIHSEKSEVVKIKDDNSSNVPAQKSVSNTTMSSSGYNSLCEEVPLLEDEVQIMVTGSNSSLPVLSIEERQYDVRGESLDTATDKPLSDNSDNKPSTSHSQVLHIGSDHGKYSFVHNPRQLPTDMSLKLPPDLPASESLEDLSLQIELKTSSLRNISLDSKGKSVNGQKVEDIPDIIGPKKSSSTDNFHAKPGLEKFYKEKIVINLPQKKSKESRSSEDVCSKPQVPVDSSSLQYQGSFKTNIERQRWFNKSSSEQRLRNVQSCSEETTVDLKDQSQNEDVQKVVISEQNHAQATIVTISHSNEPDRLDKVEEVMQQSESKDRVLHKQLSSFLSDSQLSYIKSVKEKTTSRHSLDSVIEGELRENHNDFPRKYSSPVAQNVVATHKASSEKSSTDSLLDLDNESSFRKISGGTTSDSLVPTDGEDLITTDSETDSVKLAKCKQEEAKNARKIPLTRRRRVFASKTRPESLDPPSPVDQEPARSLGDGWHEFDTHDGRKYFYNLQTREKRWKPPRRTPNTNADVEAKEETEGDGQETDDMFVVNLPLPSGYKSEVDPSSGQMCYINIHSGARWYSSTDGEGRVYFFGENSNKSSWTLPESVIPNNNGNEPTVDMEESSSISNLPIIEKSLTRYVKSKSMILGRYEEPIPLSNNWPQLWDGTMCVLKEGPLNKTKITENGKRVRKNWTSTHAVLTELLLLFFKDNKGFPSMMNGKGGPELSVDLNGAVVDTGDKVSSRKHVYMLSTVLGLQVLIQFDSASAAEQWLDAIQATIFNLPSSFGGAKGIRAKSESPSQDDKLNSRIGRSKSLKLKNSVSIEDLSNSAERQVKIRERLKKFFNRRPTVDQLVKKGIWKDEPVFGCLLEHACPPEAPRVPPFVIHCIRCIERTEENMKTDGLYRASGNLSQVQKIRLQVDQNIYSLLEEEEDVHVLAGTLKLFFRELKQPLIPFRFFNKALSASTNPHRAEKIRDFRDIVRALPPCNHDTLKILLQHLLSVTRFHEYNRMHIPNIAIVFGPTLMWPEQESTNMAFDMMQQNLVIEYFLSDFHAIFH